MQKLTIDLVAAARPNYMKIAPLYHALIREQWCDVRIVHTGQHYDKNMFDIFFRDLRLPPPDVSLGIGSGSHAEQTAGVMLAYEKRCLSERPDLIVVVGDVNATLSCTLVGSKLGIPIAHLEAGLRSNDRRMPEEINRVVTDALADLLWTSSLDASQNLLTEGLPEKRIDFVGNIMIDVLEMLRDEIVKDTTRAAFGLANTPYAVVTLHRPSNVDDPRKLEALVHELLAIADTLPIFFPVHPRTRMRLNESGLWNALQRHPAVILSEPLGYIQFMNLVLGTCVMITDSGGIQEETTYLGIPCLTIRENTERPITITQGTNRLLPPSGLLSTLLSLDMERRHTSPPQYWDGHTAERVVASLYKWYRR